MTLYIVKNTDKLNTIKMTREILEIVGDKIDTNRILLVTKINNRIPRVTKLPDPILTSQFDVITISVFIQVDN